MALSSDALDEVVDLLILRGRVRVAEQNYEGAVEGTSRSAELQTEYLSGS